MVTSMFMILLVLGVTLRYYAHKAGGGGGGAGGGGRTGGGGGTGDKLRQFFLWTALISLAGAGTFATGTIVGDFIVAICEIAPWVGWCWAIVLIFGSVKDVIGDKEPDKVAPWFLFLLPPVSDGLSGNWGDALSKMWDKYGEVVGGAVSSGMGL